MKTIKLLKETIDKAFEKAEKQSIFLHLPLLTLL